MRALPLLLASLATALPLGLNGCLYFKGETPPPAPSVFARTGWSPTAENISVHPATRQKAEGKSFVLDVRVCLHDALGDATKASGQWRFEVHAVEGRPSDRHYTPLGLWNDKVTTLADHQAHFDLTTRAYRFELPLEQPLPTGKPIKLLVVFMPEGDAHRMAAEFDLSTGK